MKTLLPPTDNLYKFLAISGLIGEVIEGVVFKDGVRATNQPDRDAA